MTDIKKDIDIYYVIDKHQSNKKIEKEIYEKILQDYDIKTFKKIKLQNDINSFNVVKRGIDYFRHIWTTQKLKSTSTRELWFLYFGKGDIPKVYDNIEIIMISQNPTMGTNKFFYKVLKSFKKTNIDINRIFKENRQLEYNIQDYFFSTNN